MEAWERAQAGSPVERPAVLLAALDAELMPEDCARLPLGTRDSQLLAWREAMFGSQLDCLADCPQCHVAVEFPVRADELRFTAPAGEHVLTLTRDGWTLSFRLPTTASLATIAGERDPVAARRRLFACCLCAATDPEGNAASAEAVPDDLVYVASERMAEADPLADLTLALRCPQCDATWEAPFDAADFFLRELRTWAGRLLRDVHELALAYGWSEAEVLALSPARRRAYLELLRA